MNVILSISLFFCAILWFC